MSYIC